MIKIYLEFFDLSLDPMRKLTYQYYEANPDINEFISLHELVENNLKTLRGMSDKLTPEKLWCKAYERQGDNMALHKGCLMGFDEKGLNCLESTIITQEEASKIIELYRIS
ncbi:MAG: hypothetical protein ISS23_03275 [Nanoarchaeota archaeon]|nr:hypothetical protein [Nanoarchaeota archaeon]